MGIEELNITEQVTPTTANPTVECGYPNCEVCSKYVTLDGNGYCTVPIVVNKQMWLITAEKIKRMERCMIEMKSLLYDHILGNEP